MNCPFCGLDPYEYAHNGLGLEPVAITCCEKGRLFFGSELSVEEVDEAFKDDDDDDNFRDTIHWHDISHEL